MNAAAEPKTPRWEEKEHRGTGQFTKGVRETLWLSYKPFVQPLTTYLVLGLLGRAALLANANVIGMWVDQFCVPTDLIQCRPAPAIFKNFSSQNFVHLLLFMTAVGFLLTWIFRVGFSRVSAKAVSQLYDEVSLRTSRYPMSFFDDTPTGRIVTRFSSDYGNVFRLFGGPLAEFLSIVFDLTCMIVLVSIASPYFFPLIAFTGLLNYLVWIFHQKRLRESRRELSASRSPSVAHFAETAQGASTIRSFNRESSFMGRFEKLDQFFQSRKLKTVKNVLQFSLHMNFLTAALLLMTGFLSYYLSAKGIVSLGSIGVAFGFIALSGNTVQMFFEWMAQFEEAMIGVERLDNYLRKPIEPGARIPAFSQFPTAHWHRDKNAEKAAQPSLKKSISVEFKDVWFQYLQSKDPVLKGVSFRLAAGERLGVIGRTGSGKSSLIQALLQLYPLSKGSIALDEKTPRLLETQNGLDLEDYRRLVAFISQDPVLFRTSLRNNLDLNGTHSDQDLTQALLKVGLLEFSKPSDLDFAIEERGKNLSVGQKQLICMARCLLQDSPLVILDEATSSVDPRSEEIMVKATEDFFQDRTQIIIAHRLSTLENCHRILWLHQGIIKQIGSPREVLPVFQASNLEHT